MVSKDQKFDPTAAENGPEHTCNNAVDDDGDGAINDGCPEVIPAAVTIDPTPAESGAQCDNALDDDKDGFVNDGCGTVNTSPSESGAQCDNNIDDDKDGTVDDGCKVGTSSETGAQCDNGTDDDADGAVNDGCPAVVGPPNTCNDGIDNDGESGIDKDDPDCLVKHVSAQLKVDDPNTLKNNQKVYWERWVYDPTNEEDGKGANTCSDNLDNNDGDGNDHADKDCYDLDPDQAGWWQVETGSIGPPSGGQKTVTLNRLFVSPCGLVTIELPEQPATVQPTPDQLLSVQCTGDVQEGNYFHCLARVDHDLGNNELDGNVTCYIDAPLLTLTGPPSALPSFADGNAGPPPPPPYATGEPQKLNGFFYKDNQQLFLRGCFSNVGGSLGPNTLVELHVDAHSLKGFTDVWFQQTNAACAAKKPNPSETPSLQLETVLTRQNINIDHDKDGCSDYDELGHGKTPGPFKKNCGDDPFNPYDSDADANGVISIAVTQIPADWDKALDELIPGFYFHCIANNVHNPDNTVTSTAMCYTDNVVLTVNCEVVGPNIYARTKVNIHTGQGTVQIATQRTNCNKPDFADEGTFVPVLIETAEQPPDWDSDLDGCTDAQELGQVQATGGLRDPYNRWDLIDMFVNKARDRRVNIIDIGAIVNRFGAIGAPVGDPLDPPQSLTGYHVSSDRSPPLVGSNLWNLGPPDGQINIIEIGEAVAQFGHTCA